MMADTNQNRQCQFPIQKTGDRSDLMQFIHFHFCRQISFFLAQLLNYWATSPNVQKNLKNFIKTLK